MALDKNYPVRIELERDNVVQVIHRDSGQPLAHCFIGDDLMVERIADILSSKYLGAAAMELREMAARDRRGELPPPPPSVLQRLKSLAKPGLFKRLFPHLG
jgi:hypothetical protein